MVLDVQAVRVFVNLPNATASTPDGMPVGAGATGAAAAPDEVVRGALPGRLYDVFMHYKRDEWESYLAAVTDWEREKYLDVMP